MALFVRVLICEAPSAACRLEGYADALAHRYGERKCSCKSSAASIIITTPSYPLTSIPSSGPATPRLATDTAIERERSLPRFPKGLALFLSNLRRNVFDESMDVLGVLFTKNGLSNVFVDLLAGDVSIGVGGGRTTSALA